MHDALFEYLKKFSPEPLSDEEIDLLRRTFKPSTLRKKQFLLQVGQQCKYLAFIVKGAMRMFTVDEKGVEHIIRLGVEGWWMADRESWSMFRPSIYHIDAWEHTEMLLITRDQTLDLMKKVPLVREMFRQLDERNNIANHRRLNSSISADAIQRYEDFRSTYPELFNRFPQHVIASYLGLNKDTLSRVKRSSLRR